MGTGRKEAQLFTHRQLQPFGALAAERQRQFQSLSRAPALNGFGAVVMTVRKNDRQQVLNHLKRAVQRIREIAVTEPGEYAMKMLSLADELAADTAKLETEMTKAELKSKPSKAPSSG